MGDTVGEDIVVGGVVGVIDVGHAGKCRGYGQHIAGGQREEQARRIIGGHRIPIECHRVGLVLVAVCCTVVNNRSRGTGGGYRNDVLEGGLVDGQVQCYHTVTASGIGERMRRSDVWCHRVG